MKIGLLHVELLGPVGVGLVEEEVGGEAELEAVRPVL